MRPIESLLVDKGMGRGCSWSSLDLETLESDVSSGKSAGSIAKDRRWPSSSVRQRVAAIKRGDPSPRYGSRCSVAPFLSQFSRHIPPEVGSTTPWTVLAAMMRGPLSHPICRQATTFCGDIERDSRCIGLVILSSLSTCHEMCHPIPWLPVATNST